jgi:precorrin-2 methylase
MPGVIIVGLGPGNPDLLTVEARRVLDAASEVHTRAIRHPAPRAAAVDGSVAVSRSTAW